MALIVRFKDFVVQNGLISENQRVLLALSGGLDSMVLAQLLLDAGYTFGVAHCNFQLRGAASEADMAFVQDWAAKHQLPCWVKRFDTLTYTKEMGVSIQMAARSLRYNWFEQLRLDESYDLLATAHHLNDHLETVLLNFVRGTGLDGLCGIPLQQHNIIRPLLFASRAELEEFAHTRGLAWREDESNASDDYDRNFMRHQVVPLLEQIRPEFLSIGQRNVQRLQGTRDNLQFLSQQYLGEDPHRVEKSRIAHLPAPAVFLHQWLKLYGFDAEQARQMAENLDSVGKEWESSAGSRMLMDRQYLLLKTETTDVHSEQLLIQEDDLMLSLPDGGRLFLMQTTLPAEFPDGKNSILVDAALLQFPLTLRRWQPGDVFQPLGMAGKHQKLQDFFTNHKSSRFEKDQTWILVNGDGCIVWVLGYRPDERFKITAQSTKGLKINLVDLA